MNWYFPEELKYTQQHEWVFLNQKEGTVTAGITDYAQDKLGKIVFAELPEPGTSVKSGDSVGVIESVKAVADIYAPVAGTISSVNEELEEKPELLNESPYSDGWIIKLEVENYNELENLMPKKEYEEFIKQEEELE